MVAFGIPNRPKLAACAVSPTVQSEDAWIQVPVLDGSSLRGSRVDTEPCLTLGGDHDGPIRADLPKVDSLPGIELRHWVARTQFVSLGRMMIGDFVRPAGFDEVGFPTLSRVSGLGTPRGLAPACDAATFGPAGAGSTPA